MRAAVAWLVVGLLLVSCDAPTGHQVVDNVTLLRQAHGGDEYPLANGIGRLVVRNGCVAMIGVSGVTYIVWHPGVELREGASGLEVVVDDASAEIGESVSIGGGYRELAGVEFLTADGAPRTMWDVRERLLLHPRGRTHARLGAAVAGGRRRSDPSHP